MKRKTKKKFTDNGTCSDLQMPPFSSFCGNGSQVELHQNEIKSILYDHQNKKAYDQDKNYLGDTWINGNKLTIRNPKTGAIIQCSGIVVSDEGAESEEELKE